ncbi:MULTISPECIES: class Ib ribonucleoside-diphosphate reductase assembly flavoprotein NrdI [Modicisalibacter]|uniref:class Ib ribonucleoside-diphosphate reductase assembly flavoprotein NrdI n=1 Tax=Modicisalibacter TaxID=574347 RepID=UPI00100A2341|nr:MULTISPECIES: class Ib ribonucleoside-diphosphate reductase assembly flavoprotein NrdI [Halomonadaceae]MBZ9558347.1 class Ib ribonucleoside-diphosphate reductase assembly flavoprotein NrdI [Modicisalibacter sp. R2A 31.J]MBZ9575761.1 class Ib ribonucleoside-diphosphate reductase assembly flavoprotein NrdI [Modicisalibacter sp. MOD 31.J]
MIDVVYFSTQSNNTHRFVQKLDWPAWRIPISRRESLQAERPYVLVVPTYGDGDPRTAVPAPVIRFLNDPRNRALIRGVVAGGNTNFGSAYALAGHVIAHKCGVPFLYRFELMGTPEDVARVRECLAMETADVG